LNLNDVTVVIRTANERTIGVCKQAVLREVSEESVFPIAIQPFSAAVKKNFEIGIEQNKKWTLALDADLILLDGAIGMMVEEAEKAGDNLYVYQGRILDKFKVGVRQGGPHLYLTKSLERVQPLLPEIEGRLRPESWLYQKMVDRGFKSVIDQRLFALHDYEQYHCDIYRKAYFHGIKHPLWRHTSMLEWFEKAETDPDYVTAIRGFVDGYFETSKEYPSVDALREKFEKQTVAHFNIEEKKELTSLLTGYSQNEVKQAGVKIDSAKNNSFVSPPFKEKIVRKSRMMLQRILKV